MPRKRTLGGLRTLPNLYWGGVGGGVPTWDFDPLAVTFTPKMAKRTAPGPFAAAPIIQGDWDNLTIPDVLTYPRGVQISENFYSSFDPYQGSIVAWITPEQDRDASLGKNTYWRFSSSHYVEYDHANNRFTLYWGQSSFNATYALVAGTTFCLVLRWDSNNTLDGSNYLCISIDDVHTFGGTQPNTVNPDSSHYIGSWAGSTRPSQTITEGYTIYRRVLYDGTYGVDAGNGDELNLIYASGAGAKPESITGWSDICFQLPTDGVVGELVSGTGEAFSYPWTSNKLLNWHMQDDDDTPGAPDDWTAVNAPILADAATADILYGTRSQKMSVDAADEGIKQAYAVSAGEDYSVSAWVKTGGADQGVDVRIRDATGAADITELTTDATAYTLLETTFEVPVGCTSVEVYVESTDADTYDIHIGQVQIQPDPVVLDDVSITVTPASEVNSTEDGGIRVDGYDSCVTDITGKLGATAGKVRFNWTPRHGYPNFNKFGAGFIFFVDEFGSTDNRFFLSFASDYTFQALIKIAGVAQSDDWEFALGITAGTTYLIEMEYDDTNFTVSWDGVVKITVTPAAGIDFGANIPDIAYIGTGQFETYQSDAVFSAPG